MAGDARSEVVNSPSRTIPTSNVGVQRQVSRCDPRGEQYGQRDVPSGGAKKPQLRHDQPQVVAGAVHHRVQRVPPMPP